MIFGDYSKVHASGIINSKELKSRNEDIISRERGK